MGRMQLICVIVSIGLIAPASRGDVADRVAELTAQVAKLTAEIETLKAENAALKLKLAEKERNGAGKTGTETAPATTFALGETAKLGAYQYRTPEGWTYQGVKNNTLGALYRSPDKAGVILVVVRPKGAAPLEMQAKYGQNIVQKLKEDFLRAKTEVVEPPAVVSDARFYLKVHERIKVKEKVADQTHAYLMPGKDMIELSVITTAEASDQVAATQRLAEDVLMSFAPAGK
jgi:hypothetical protein